MAKTRRLAILLLQVPISGLLACPCDGADFLTLLQDLLSPVSSTNPHPAVVRITVPEGRAFSLGSGTLVDVHENYGLVLTNWHVVRDATGDVVVTFPDGFQSAATVLRADQNWDLAALLIWSPPSAVPMPLAAAVPQPGDRLTIAGYGQGTYREVTGRCTQYVAPGADDPYEMVEVSVRARQGDSGGPIMNQNGELAGVLFGSTRSATSGSYVGRVQTFLAEMSEQLRAESVSLTSVGRQIVNGPPEVASTQPAVRQPLARATKAVVPTEAHNAIPVEVEITQSTGSGNEDAVAIRPSAPEGNSHQPALPEPDMHSITLDHLIGFTLWGKTKSVFAIIGVLAVVHHVARKLA